MSTTHTRYGTGAERFFERIEDVRRLGYPEEFLRMWHYYLCYCEGGFLERAISDVQLVFDKPDTRLSAPVLDYAETVNTSRGTFPAMLS